RPPPLIVIPRLLARLSIRLLRVPFSSVMKRDEAVVAPEPEEGTPAARQRTFRSLRVRNFRLFIVGQLVSATGTWMQSVAAPFLVLQLTHSGVALGIDTGLQFLPIMLFGAWGGVVADRFDNRRLQVATQVAFA